MLNKKKRSAQPLNYLLLPLLVILWGLNKLGSFLLIVIFNLPRKIFEAKKMSSEAFKIYDHKKRKQQPKPFLSGELLSDFLKNLFALPGFWLSVFKSFVLNIIRLSLWPFKFVFSKIPFKKRRGRPRSLPLRSYLWGKYKRFLNKIFPSPLRLAVVVGVLLTLGFFYSAFLVGIAHDLPSPEKLAVSQSPVTSEIYDRNGKLLYRLYEGKNRTPVKVENLPPYLIQATISMEDKNFYAHSGIDLAGIARAITAYIDKKQVQGGSTITQQLIKNTLLTPDRTLQRKVKEVALSFWAERIFSKKDILQMYFNEVPYGGPAWGIEAAAKTYFGKSAKDLTLSESAYLVGLPASPTVFSPYGANPELGKERQQAVLRRMVEDGYISQKQADEALKEELKITPPTQQIIAPHFVMYVRSILAQKYGEKTVSQGGLKVTTSLDLNIQKMVEEVVANEVDALTSLNVTNGAAMVTDAQTGQILAMVGSKNYWDPNSGNFNVATAPRQPGSSIKPITYATGFKQGYSAGSVLLDAPIAYRNEWEVYAPVNYDGKFHGPVSIRTALGSSYNIPAVKMLASVGIPAMVQTAKDMGITTLDDEGRYGLSLTLGGGEIKLIDMMSVYGTFSQMGEKHDIQPILKITDGNGNILEETGGDYGRQVIDQGIAYIITDILADNKARTPAFGPNSLLNISGYTVAVKTGTTDNKRDNWTFGYTPELVVGVWVGNNNNQPMDPKLTSGVTGAAPIWNKIMVNLLKGTQNVTFKRPDNVIIGANERSSSSNEASASSSNKDLILTNSAGIKPVVADERNVKSSPKTDESISFTDPLTPVREAPVAPNP